MSPGVHVIGAWSPFRVPRQDRPANRNPEFAPAKGGIIDIWRCNCGCELFQLTRHGARCANCWHISSDWAEA